MTIAENSDNWGKKDVRTVDAHPLRTTFSEGNGSRAETGVAARGTGVGATWNCASDTNIANQKADCKPPWNGGDFRPATAPSVTHANGQADDVAWDVTADVRARTSGWLIKKTNEESSGQVTYYSKEGAHAAASPVLARRLLLEWR